MKFSLVLTIVSIHICRVSADLAVRLLLNKGETLSTAQSCTGQEWETIVQTTEATYDAIYARRNLRRLQTFPSWCAEKCKGFAKGYCQGRHPKCEGYRRLQAKNAANAPAISPELAPATAPALAPVIKIAKKLSIRALFAPTCQDDINEINASLEQVKSSFNSASGCKAVLNSPREYECLTTIDNCRIQKIQLLNAADASVLKDSFTSGMSVCANVPVMFRAVKDPCVCNVQFNLKDSNGLVIHDHFVFHEPYVSHTEPNADGQLGQKLTVGTYSLDYYPDSDKGLLKTITFPVNNC